MMNFIKASGNNPMGLAVPPGECSYTLKENERLRVEMHSLSLSLLEPRPSKGYALKTTNAYIINTVRASNTV